MELNTRTKADIAGYEAAGCTRHTLGIRSRKPRYRHEIVFALNGYGIGSILGAIAIVISRGAWCA